MAERMSGPTPRASGRLPGGESDAPRKKSRAGGRHLPDEESPRPAAGSTKESRRTPTKRVIALVYDFDGTLSPKPMQEYGFLPKLGIDPKEFWAECTALARAERADPLITYMHLMYKKAKEKGVRIDRADLVAQGANVEYFPGVEQWFGEIDAYVQRRAELPGVKVKHYLVSSGLTEIVEGTSIYKNFANVFASEYWFDAYDLPYPKRVITDTGKTQYLFRINKGREDYNDSINSHMPESERPIPFSNMIYFGDGETDVPGMALLKKNGGAAIAVYNPQAPGGRLDEASSRPAAGSTEESRRAQSKEESPGASKKCEELFQAGRCDFYAAADYRAGSDLFKRTTLLLDRILAEMRIKAEASGLG